MIKSIRNDSPQTIEILELQSSIRSKSLFVRSLTWTENLGRARHDILAQDSSDDARRFS